MAPATDSPAHPEIATKDSKSRDSNGWDGKLRVQRRAEVTNAEILSDPEYSDEDAPPVEKIVADEGRYLSPDLCHPLML